MTSKNAPTFEERYKALNKEQKRAVDTTEGPVMVVAGPGTGKTELISLRVGKILKQGTASANSILCLTFTETAATNMRDRLEQLIGPDAFRVSIYTFHGFCTEVMGKYPEYFYNASRMRPASELVQSEILESIFARLPHKQPLSAYHPEMGYSYLKEVQSKIKDIKKGGLTPVRFKEIIEENKKLFTTLNLLVARYVPERIDKESSKAFEALHKELVSHDELLSRAYASVLRLALEDAEHEGKNAPLSAWKAKHTAKDEHGARVWKDSLATEKLLALADIYKAYQEELYRRGYFDYEDMIIEVVEALAKHPTLRSELEERYQYIMVDEFQDTNNAQLSLVKAISSNEVHEGHPNVCVVGDDDQAVYKFQGAEISNILSFEQLYNDVERIVLVENYRSTQDVLDFARSIVTQGVERLERLKNIRKDLVAKNKALAQGAIALKEFGTEEDEYAYVAEEVKKKLEDGESPSEIAIIAREHKQLRAILPYLDALSIPYTYVREENVFDEPHVRELVMLCRFLGSMIDERFQEEGLLPEILSFPFWGLDRASIWGIAEEARAKNVSWLSVMKESKNKQIASIASFLIELGVLSQTVPLEIILDILIGAKEMPEVTDDEYDDTYEGREHVKLASGFSSPYKEFYFGKEVYKKNPSKYINFLSSLSVFVKALREYKEGEMLKAANVGPFVDMHIDYRIPLINNTPFAHNEDAVSLLTSHGAKGLEFACVFVISANDDIWAGRAKGNKISFPANLPLSQTPDDEDDFIRLFYVALTRARHTLLITHHASPFRFLLHEKVLVRSVPHTVPTQSELLATGLKVYHVPPFAYNEKALLQKVLEGYKLSPTHLNNFLDIVSGGPMKFLEQNLLRFPQAKTKSSVYGTAIHKALEDLYKETKKTGKVPPLSFVLASFEKELKRGRLIDYEEEQQKHRGEVVLARYYKEHTKKIDPKTVVELDFSKQGVVIGSAQVTGKIDKVVEANDGSWSVIDLKTGKGMDTWDEKGTQYEKIKLHKYKHQLMMYKLLVEHARDYERHTVKEGVLEFVEEEEDGTTKILSLSFEGKDMRDELENFKRLLSIVYEKIMNLDFPDTSSYPQTLEGVLQFEQDLISGKV